MPLCFSASIFSLYAHAFSEYDGNGELTIFSISVTRNDKLSALFYRLKLIEAYGTGVPGIPGILETYARFGGSPSMPAANGGFLISPPNHSVASSAIDAPKGDEAASYLISQEANSQSQTPPIYWAFRSAARKILLQRMAQRGVLRSAKHGKEIVYSSARFGISAQLWANERRRDVDDFFARLR
jgi:ATP-dependent DNA helicase RecG